MYHTKHDASAEKNIIYVTCDIRIFYACPLREAVFTLLCAHFWKIKVLDVVGTYPQPFLYGFDGLIFGRMIFFFCISCELQGISEWCILLLPDPVENEVC